MDAKQLLRTEGWHGPGNAGKDSSTAARVLEKEQALSSQQTEGVNQSMENY